jgi:hypothetical protein
MRRAHAIAALAATLASACTRASLPVRPAASAVVSARDPVLFSPPFALATPEDAVVRVLGPDRTCSGTLVEDDLVLTAHHCVVDDRGAMLLPEALRIELGGDYLPWGSVRARDVLAPPCGATGGTGDLAVLVLERKLVGMATMAPRLDVPPRIGEELDPVGFGRCATSGDGIHRHQLAGGPVRATTAATFVMQASICPGDSGGPVLARGRREVVGVVSQSAMDGDPRTIGTTVLARVDGYRALFAEARQVADGVDRSELPPISCSP